MRFGLVVGTCYLIIFTGLYIVATGQTAGSFCRDSGQAIWALAIDEDGGGGMEGLRRSIQKLGRSIEATCTRR